MVWLRYLFLMYIVFFAGYVIFAEPLFTEPMLAEPGVTDMHNLETSF